MAAGMKASLHTIVRSWSDARFHARGVRCILAMKTSDTVDPLFWACSAK
jgi:hypothetical protein